VRSTRGCAISVYLAGIKNGDWLTASRVFIVPAHFLGRALRENQFNPRGNWNTEIH